MVEHLSVLCGKQSLWGWLILFSGIQLALSILLFPGVISIFDTSVTVRDARTKVEKAAAELDAVLRYDPTGYAANPDNFATVVSAASVYTDNSKGPLATQNLADARNYYTSVMARYFPQVTSPNFQIEVVVSSVDTTAVGIPAATGDVYIVPGTPPNVAAFASTSTGAPLSPSFAASTKVATANFKTPVNVTGVQVQATLEKQTTQLLKDAMMRTEVFAGFYFLQWIVGMVFIGYALRAFQAKVHAKVLPIIAGVGLFLTFVAWVSGFYPYSLWQLGIGWTDGNALTTHEINQPLNTWSNVANIPNSVFSTFYLSSYILSLLSAPYASTLLLLWILITLYSNYVVTWVERSVGSP